MERIARDDAEHARSCTAEEIGALLHSKNEAQLLALLQNPHLKETHLQILLERRDVSAVLLERIAARKDWLRAPSLRRNLVAHLHTPRPLAMKLARELDVMDLAAISLRSAVSAEVRRLADDLLLARLAQLPLGHKLTLARRGPGRAAAGLLPVGDERIARVALENPHLTEAQLLRALADEKLSAGVLSVIAGHAKWSCLGTVRAALVRHSNAPLERILPFLPDLARAELNQLGQSADLRANLRRAIRDEIAARAERRAGPR